MKHLLSFILLLLFFLGANAQEQNVAYKTKTYSYHFNKHISIKTNCEMAELVFTKNNGNTIDIKCTYSAKHNDKAIATRELERHNILVRKTLNDIYISNYFTISNNEKEPNAKLKIKFEISIPESVSIDIHNNFGSFSATNIELKGSINQDFGKIELTAITGDLKIISNLTDVVSDIYSGKLEIRNKSGDVLIKNTKGNNALLFIDNTNAKISLQNIASSVNVKLHISNCTVSLEKVELEKHNVLIESVKQPIIADSKYKLENKNNKYYLLLNADKPLPGFIIQSTFSNIKIN
jgi:hypothetical protein